MDKLRVALIQTEIIWKDIEGNLNLYSELLKEHENKFDVCVLPEMFNTGFSMEPSGVSENMDGQTIKWMLKIASHYKSLIVGSIIIKAEGCYYNRLIMAFPNGRIDFYNKRHLFSMAGEDNKYTAGKGKTIIEYNGWKICCQICYDLRFPVYSRNSLINSGYEYDCLIYVANWPKSRRSAWLNLLEARAHENQCYVVGVNRLGSDNNGFEFCGDSVVFSPKGENLLDLQNQKKIGITNIKKEPLNNYREKFPTLADADYFEIKESQ